MAKSLLFWLGILLANIEFVFPKDTSLKHSKTYNNGEHFEQEHNSFLKQKPFNNQAKNFLYRSIPQRCSIICPIIFPDICNYPAAPQISQPPSTSQTGTYSVSQTSAPIQSQNNTVNNFVKQVTNFPQLFGTAPQRILGRNNRKHGQNNIHIPLTKHQKRILLKHTNLRRSYGKNVQKLRQFSANNCQVVCTEVVIETVPHIPQTYYNGGNSGSDQSQTESDEEESDNYVEGEDTPIEITQKPILPQNELIEGIKPVGPVNFFGWDDFGPNGQPAGYPEFIEEKTHLRRKKKPDEKSKNSENILS